MVLLDDVVRDPQSDSGALLAFRGVEGLKEMSAVLPSDARAVVEDADAHAQLAGCGVPRAPHTQHKPVSLAGHRIHCVDDEVGEHLLQLYREAHHRALIAVLPDDLD